MYSFGVVLWELWTGKEPYEGLNYHALLHQITLTGGTLRPTLPNSPKWEGEPAPEPAPGWCNLVERCWQEAPEQRPSFAEVTPPSPVLAVLAHTYTLNYILMGWGDLPADCTAATLLLSMWVVLSHFC